MDKTTVTRKCFILLPRLEAHTGIEHERKNKVVNKLEKQREEYVSILENKNEEIKILKDKIVFFTKLFKSCMAHKREIKELKETIKDLAFKMNMKEEEIKQLKETFKDKAFKMDLKEHIVRDMQAKLDMKETIVRDLQKKWTRNNTQ